MNRKRILQILGIALSAVIAAVAILPLEQASHDGSRWMSGLADDAPLNSLTIPGTHDSGALYSFAGVSGKCQSVSIGQQLKMGVRFLDIRLKLDRNELKVVHSFVDQKLTLADVLEDVTGFIRENPSEFLLISFKEDDSPRKSDVTFSGQLEEMLAAYRDVIVPDSALPSTVGEARGKIYILSRYADASIGIPAYHGWQDSTSFAIGSIFVQDHYEISAVSHKQKDIRDAVEKAASGKYSLTLNFTSCYLDHGFPPMSAAAPAREINPWLMEFLTSCSPWPGVFVCDYITSELAAALTERNFQ